MARVCQVTGKKPMVGNNVSHANNKTKRRFLPNLQYRRLWVESENRWISLRISNAGLRLIDKRGIDADFSRYQSLKQKIGGAEITRLGVRLGANPLTFLGLSGMGDLVLTCTGDLSRNRSVGIALGQGRRLEEILAGMAEVAEGVRTTHAACELADRVGVELPIAAMVREVLEGKLAPAAAVQKLMTRELKHERA